MRGRRAAIVLAVVTGCPCAVSAQPVCLSGHLKEENPVIFGTVGQDVAICGDTVVVGAPGVGGSIGKAHVFQYTERDGWVEVQELHPFDGDFGDKFGQQVVIENDIIAIRSGNWDEKASHSGAVYLFRNIGSEWVFEQKLFITDGPDVPFTFGRSIGFDAGRLAVAGRGSALGHLYIFEHDGDEWVQTQFFAKETDSGLFSGNDGQGMAISGDLIIGGAQTDDAACPDDPDWPEKFCSYCDSGAAFIFRYDPDIDEWVEEAKLTLEPPQCEQQFGLAVAIEDERVLVAANWPRRVYVYEFDTDSATWEQTTVLYPPQTAQQFGRMVDLKGETALVGAPSSGGEYSGFAFVYQRTPSGEWIQRAALGAEPNVCCGLYGRSVALSDSRAIVGAPGESVGGAAYVYDLDPLTGDINCDEAVDVLDLLLALEQWGPCPEPGENTDGCPADLNEDGEVNVLDLLILLENWS